MDEKEKFQIIDLCIRTQECVDIDDSLICVYYLYHFNDQVYALGHKLDEPGIIFNEKLLAMNKAATSGRLYSPVATAVMKQELMLYYIDPIRDLEEKGFRIENEVQL